MKNISEVISFFRKKKKMTQEELGNLTNLSRVTIAKIENSQRAISLDEAVRIAEVLGTDIDTMYGYISNDEQEEERSFVMAFRTSEMTSSLEKEIKRIELLVDALFTQEQIRGE